MEGETVSGRAHTRHEVRPFSQVVLVVFGIEVPVQLRFEGTISSSDLASSMASRLTAVFGFSEEAPGACICVYGLTKGCLDSRDLSAQLPEI